MKVETIAEIDARISALVATKGENLDLSVTHGLLDLLRDVEIESEHDLRTVISWTYVLVLNVLIDLPKTEGGVDVKGYVETACGLLDNAVTFLGKDAVPQSPEGV